MNEKAEFTFQGYPVEVQRRPYQRSLNLRVRPSGRLRVTCGRSVRIEDIQKFIAINKIFLQESLAKVAALKARFPRLEFLSGEPLMFQGQKLPLEVYWGWQKRVQVKILEDRIEVKAPIGSTREHRQKAIAKAYAKVARPRLAERVLFFAEQMKLYPSEIGFRGQRTRWGSCSSQGKVSLNWKLIGAPAEVLDYVVVHELAHLAEANHSSRFWKIVGDHCPQYKRLRRWLRDNHYELEFLEPKSELHR